MSRLRKWWEWLRDPGNHGALGFICTFIVAVSGGIWAFYTFVENNKVPQKNVIEQKKQSSIAINPNKPEAVKKVEFTGYNSAFFLTGQEFANQGLWKITTYPSNSYCSDVIPTITHSTKYGDQKSFLTTSNYGSSETCNTVPIKIAFTHPVHKVNVRFIGANTSYTIEAFSSDGSKIKYQDSEVYLRNLNNPKLNEMQSINIVSTEDNIAFITFGHQSALTAIYDIKFAYYIDNTEKNDDIQNLNSSPFFPISIAKLNASKWFGYDGRKGFESRKVGTGQSILFNQDILLNSISVCFSAPFKPSLASKETASPVKAVMRIWDESGSEVIVTNIIIPEFFRGGWVSFPFSKKNVYLKADVKYLVTWYLSDDSVKNVHSGSSGNTNNIYKNGTGYSAVVQNIHDFKELKNWVEQTWDFLLIVDGVNQ